MNDEILKNYFTELAKECCPKETATLYRNENTTAPHSHIFDGEIAYFSENYSAALEAYLKAKSHALSPFFCYRAAALIHWQRGEHAEAKEKADRARSFFPNDTNLQKITHAEEVQQLRSIFTAKEVQKELFCQESVNAEECCNDASLSLEQILKKNCQTQKEWIEALGKTDSPTPKFRLSCFGQCSLDHVLVKLLPFSPPSSYTIHGESGGLVINPGRGFLQRFLNGGGNIDSLECILITRGDILTIGDTLALIRLKAALASQKPLALFAPPLILQRIQTNLQDIESSVIAAIALPSEGTKTHTLSPDLSFEVFTPPHAATSEGALYRYGVKVHTKELTVGFATGLSYSDELSSMLKGCDILIAGIGKSTHSDLTKGALLTDCLGYTGVKTLIEKTEPKVAFLDELQGCFGDLRLEFTRQLRCALSDKTTLLPSTLGLAVDLKKMRIELSDKAAFVKPSQVRVIRSLDNLAPLFYTSANDIL